MSVNQWVGIGRLTKDVELKYSKSGVAMARFTLAVNRIKKQDNGQEADFISILAFNKLAENVANFTSKGSQVAVTGSIQTGSYEKDGQRIFTTDVIAQSVQFLDSKKDSNQQQGQAQPQQQQQPMQQQQFAQQQFNQQQGFTQQQNFASYAPQFQPQQQPMNQPQGQQFAQQMGAQVIDENLPF